MTDNDRTDRVEAGQRWQHVKRGTSYDVVGLAELQMSADLVDGSSLVLYRGDDGKLWAREEGEFTDGRFHRLAALSGAAGVREDAPWGKFTVDMTPRERLLAFAEHLERAGEWCSRQGGFYFNGPDYAAYLREAADFLASRPTGEAATIPVGMKPWAGGDKAPADWNGGELLLRNGEWDNGQAGNDWRHTDPAVEDSDTDIIAYTPTSAPAGDGERREVTQEDRESFAATKDPRIQDEICGGEWDDEVVCSAPTTDRATIVARMVPVIPTPKMLTAAGRLGIAGRAVWAAMVAAAPAIEQDQEAGFVVDALGYHRVMKCPCGASFATGDELTWHRQYRCHLSSEPDGWIQVKVNNEGGIVMPYGRMVDSPDHPGGDDTWAPFFFGTPR